MQSLRLALAASLLLPLSSPVFAGASAWHAVEGGSLRIVTERPDANGHLRGALELRLEPGWKTYWMDPGDAGVPPTLTIRHDGAAIPLELRFPAPRRFADAYSAWAGYDGDIAFAFTLDLPARPSAPPALDADIFLGLCEQICIPVQASLAVDPAAEGTAGTEAAFAALPGAPTGAVNAALAQAAGDRLEVDVAAGSSDTVALFVATDGKAMLGAPRETGREGATRRFAIKVLSGAADAQSRFPYTLVTSAGAVSGVLRLPPPN